MNTLHSNQKYSFHCVQIKTINDTHFDLLLFERKNLEIDPTKFSFVLNKRIMKKIHFLTYNIQFPSSI